MILQFHYSKHLPPLFCEWPSHLWGPSLFSCPSYSFVLIKTQTIKYTKVRSSFCAHPAENRAKRPKHASRHASHWNRMTEYEIYYWEAKWPLNYAVPFMCFWQGFLRKKIKWVTRHINATLENSVLTCLILKWNVSPVYLYDFTMNVTCKRDTTSPAIFSALTCIL